MRVLVTGANGHIGCNVIRELVAREHEPVPMVRETSNTEGLDPLGLRYRYGDIRDADAVHAAAEGCDAVIHLAAILKTHGLDVETVAQLAVTGVENVLRAAADHGLRRVVHVSSMVAVGFNDHPVPLDECSWSDGVTDAYFVAKLRSERRAWKLATTLGVPLICLCPTYVIGPHDYRIGPAMGVIRGLTDRSMPSMNGGINIVDVRDVARTLVQAVDAGRVGERYILGGANTSSREVAQALATYTGKQTRHLNLPRSLIVALASLDSSDCSDGRSPPRPEPPAT